MLTSLADVAVVAAEAGAERFDLHLWRVGDNVMSVSKGIYYIAIR